MLEVFSSLERITQTNVFLFCLYFIEEKEHFSTKIKHLNISRAVGFIKLDSFY